MIRENWRFEYAASDLAAAAQTKMSYHQSRLDFWKTKKNEVMDSIRADGLEIDEKIVLEFHNIKARDWVNGAQVMIRNDLQRDLDECLKKLSYHSQKLADYDSWHQILSANPKRNLEVDNTDWMFFFGK